MGHSRSTAPPEGLAGCAGWPSWTSPWRGQRRPRAPPHRPRRALAPPQHHETASPHRVPRPPRSAGGQRASKSLADGGTACSAPRRRPSSPSYGARCGNYAGRTRSCGRPRLFSPHSSTRPDPGDRAHRRAPAAGSPRTSSGSAKVASHLSKRAKHRILSWLTVDQRRVATTVLNAGLRYEGREPCGYGKELGFRSGPTWIVIVADTTSGSPGPLTEGLRPPWEKPATPGRLPRPGSVGGSGTSVLTLLAQPVFQTDRHRPRVVARLQEQAPGVGVHPNVVRQVHGYVPSLGGQRARPRVDAPSTAAGARRPRCVRSGAHAPATRAMASIWLRPRNRPVHASLTQQQATGWHPTVQDERRDAVAVPA